MTGCIRHQRVKQPVRLRFFGNTFIGSLILVFVVGCLSNAHAQPIVTNLYHTNRVFEQIVYTNLGETISAYEAITEAERLYPLVGPTNIIVDTNNTFATEYESFAWGYASPEEAWAMVVSNKTAYPFIHEEKTFENVGWVKGTRYAHDTWGAYLWLLQNTVAFETSETNIWVSPGGVTNLIAQVIVGSIGDFPPMTNIVDVGPTNWVDIVEYLGEGEAEDMVYRGDYTAYYRLVTIEFLDASEIAVSALKVGKWENAFNAGPPVTVKDHFIDLDPDRFRLRVRDLSRTGVGAVSVKLSTDSPGTAYDDPPTEIELYEDPPNSGVFYSTNLLLVSDTTDDVFTNPHVAPDNTLNDRTHRIALGGVVKVQYPANQPVMEQIAHVPPDLRAIDVEIIILRDRPAVSNGVPVISVAEVDAFWTIARERYAQIGVDIRWTEPVIEDPPAGVDLFDGLTVMNTATSRTLAVEAKNLITALGTTNTINDIHVFYVNEVKMGLETLGGLAVAPYWFNPPTEQPYTFNIFISAFTQSPWGGYAAAHELTHLTTDAAHQPFSWQLMHGTLETTGVTGSRRLTEAEEIIIRGCSHVY